MQAAQAVGTVVPVAAARSVRGDQPTAVFTGKALFTGMVLILAFFKLFSLIFPVHGITSKKSFFNTFGRLGL